MFKVAVRSRWVEYIHTRILRDIYVNLYFFMLFTIDIEPLYNVAGLKPLWAYVSLSEIKIPICHGCGVHFSRTKSSEIFYFQNSGLVLWKDGSEGKRPWNIFRFSTTLKAESPNDFRRNLHGHILNIISSIGVKCYFFVTSFGRFFLADRSFGWSFQVFFFGLDSTCMFCITSHR